MAAAAVAAAPAAALPSQRGGVNAWGWGARTLLLVLICIMSFSIRLFSVVKYESVIHEFDPYFNYRVTQYLTQEGFYNMWDWFDDRTWYPLGRVVGGTVYPGLIYTAGTMYNILHALNIPVHVQEVCVFTAPLFSALCALAAYGLVSECRDAGAGLAAAALVGMVPSYISRSVAGSYDNEGVAIFALVFVFYTYIKTINTGSLRWAAATLGAYFYMVLSWGGYSFVINLIPIHALACVVSGRATSRHYVAFAPLVIVGTLLAASIPVVGFNAVLMSEHFGAFLACGVLHAFFAARAIRALLPPKQRAAAVRYALIAAAGVATVAVLGVTGYVLRSPTLGWTGRSLTLLDPTYASRFVPIIASVSEHQPPSWPSYITDLHFAALLAPAGIIAAFRRLDNGSLFLVLYGITAVYFSGVMVRLMLVLAPAVCCLSGVAISDALGTLTASLKASVNGARQQLAAMARGGGGGSGRLRHASSSSGGAADDDAAAAAADGSGSAAAVASPPPTKRGKRGSSSGGSAAGSGDAAAARAAGSKADAAHAGWSPLPAPVAAAGLGLMLLLMARYTVHCVGVSADMYSAPSIVLQSGRQDGGVYVFDDFREAYGWLRHNTAPDAKVASWWDYGYQTTAMANRTVIVDNNTWNTSHIATVGRAMASPEFKAWKIYRSLDVEYVFVVFGGLIGYSSDDINKFLWMVRIGGGVYPDIREQDYLTPQGHFRIDAGGSPTMLRSLMYKLSYHDFAEAAQNSYGQYGHDRVRNTVIGKTDVPLKYFEEAFTSEHHMMRIYRVRDAPNRAKAKDSGRARKPLAPPPASQEAPVSQQSQQAAAR